MEIAQISMTSPIGVIYLQATPEGLLSISWEQARLPLTAKLNRKKPSHRHLLEAKGQLADYFAGKRQQFQLALDLQGTDFQKKVWRELTGLKFGDTASYAEIARRIGSPKATRAVGSANGKNPLCIVVPCHRVISSNGSLGGYSGFGGLRTKKKLLKLEKAI